jgi:hypothetical protein
MDFDIRAEVRSFIVNADCKTRTNLFPFNLPRFNEEPPEGIRGYFGSRATIDPHDAIAAAFSCPRLQASTTSRHLKARSFYGR